MPCNATIAGFGALLSVRCTVLSVSSKESTATSGPPGVASAAGVGAEAATGPADTIEGAAAVGDAAAWGVVAGAGVDITSDGDGLAAAETAGVA